MTRYVWIVAAWFPEGDERGWECQGVFTTQEQAKEICKPGRTYQVVRFEIDRDCTNDLDFDVLTIV